MMMKDELIILVLEGDKESQAHWKMESIAWMVLMTRYQCSEAEYSFREGTRKAPWYLADSGYSHSQKVCTSHGLVIADRPETFLLIIYLFLSNNGFSPITRWFSGLSDPIDSR
jgi:hypothetical protein